MNNAPTIREQIFTIIQNYIHYSPQVQGFVVHGAIDKIEEFFKEELQKILEWGCRQGYDPNPGILQKIEIKGVGYTIPEAIEMYLKSNPK